MSSSVSRNMSNNLSPQKVVCINTLVSREALARGVEGGAAPLRERHIEEEKPV
jgi:hypothetical protein